eukprot:GEMP01046500.1.p1 GENE.GEMP01046500.1~~GEMP01046500.1.p1  ORF type:complete len:308 (+),score=85.90 GEMP01046500.1:252-1175(+)
MHIFAPHPRNRLAAMHDKAEMRRQAWLEAVEKRRKMRDDEERAVDRVSLRPGSVDYERLFSLAEPRKVPLSDSHSTSAPSDGLANTSCSSTPSLKKVDPRGQHASDRLYAKRKSNCPSSNQSEDSTAKPAKSEIRSPTEGWEVWRCGQSRRTVRTIKEVERRAQEEEEYHKTLAVPCCSRQGVSLGDSVNRLSKRKEPPPKPPPPPVPKLKREGLAHLVSRLQPKAAPRKPIKPKITSVEDAARVFAAVERLSKRKPAEDAQSHDRVAAANDDTRGVECSSRLYNVKSVDAAARARKMMARVVREVP